LRYGLTTPVAAAGSTFLLQQYRVHLRTDPLPFRTAYVLNCAGPARAGDPSRLPDGDYHTEVSFTLRRPRAFREKALNTASITCGGSSYLQPILPLVTTMKQVPAFTIQPSPSTIGVLLPRIAGAIGTETQARARSQCGS
jgi:hypothetical protein